MVELLQKEEKEPILDHCGIIAAYITEDIPFFMTGVSGLKKLQTRGIDGAGVYARLSNGEILVHKGKGKIEEALNKEAIADLVHARAKIWLLQTRYGTNGSGNLENIQPIIRKHMDGSVFSIVHNGEFSSNRRGTNGESDTVCFANELAKSPQTSWDERILAAQRKSKGAWSLAVDTNSGLYLMRDELGIRPLSFGYKSVEGKKIWTASSETAGLSAMGMRDIKEVLPGQVIRINENGPKILQITNCEFSKMSTCIFENVYLGNGHSAIHRPRSTMV